MAACDFQLSDQHELTCQPFLALSNVALLLFAGREIWFHSVAGDEQIIAIYDYIEAMVRANRYLPPPPALAPQVFDVFDWPAPEAEPRPDGPACHEPLAVGSGLEV